MPRANEAGDARRAVSFLVRFWWEEREGADREPVLRGYLRNLYSGEGRHLADPSELPAPILRHLLLDSEAGLRGSEAADEVGPRAG